MAVVQPPVRSFACLVYLASAANDAALAALLRWLELGAVFMSRVRQLPVELEAKLERAKESERTDSLSALVWLNSEQ